MGLFINTLPVRIRVADEGAEASVRRTHRMLADLMRRTADLPHTVCPTTADAWQAAQAAAGPDDLICIRRPDGGSFS